MEEKDKKRGEKARILSGKGGFQHSFCVGKGPGQLLNLGKAVAVDLCHHCPGKAPAL